MRSYEDYCQATSMYSRRDASSSGHGNGGKTPKAQEPKQASNAWVVSHSTDQLTGSAALSRRSRPSAVSG